MNARDHSVDVCVSKQDEGIIAHDFIARSVAYYKRQCAKTCEDAIHAADENDVTRMLTTIGDCARLLRERGDLDEKIAFVDDVAKMIDAQIGIYAASEAEHDLNKASKRGGL
jgi:hypothetical protein